MSDNHPTSYTIDLTSYYKNSLCPLCKLNRIDTEYYVDQDFKYSVDERVVSTLFCTYKEYENNSTKVFGQMSLPLCITCWEKQCTCCDICWIPMSSVYGGYLGWEVLYDTTFVNQSKNSQKRCEQCNFTKMDHWVLMSSKDILKISKVCKKSRPCRHEVMLNGKLVNKLGTGTWNAPRIKKWCEEHNINVPMHFIKYD